MFSCERCGSSYSAAHAAAMENCPRCKVRDRVAAPLTFRLFSEAPGGQPPVAMQGAKTGSLGAADGSTLAR
jgi:hypothetical protein